MKIRRDTQVLRAGLAAVAVAGLAWLGHVQPAQSQPKSPARIYTVPVYCGRFLHNGSVNAYPRLPVAPGSYFTSVTIRNFGNPVSLTRRIAVALRGTPGNSTAVLNINLGTGQSINFDCEHFRLQASVSGDANVLIGDLLLQSRELVEVTAVHSSSPLNSGVGSFQVTRVTAQLY